MNLCGALLVVFHGFKVFCGWRFMVSSKVKSLGFEMAQALWEIILLVPGKRENWAK